MEDYNQPVTINDKTVVSVILVYEDIDFKAFESLHASLKESFAYFELIVVGSPTNEFMEFENNISNFSNVRLLFSNIITSYRQLRQLAFVEAIGDVVVLYDPSECDANIIPKLVEKNLEGFNFVGTYYEKSNRFWYSFFDKIFTFILSFVSGYKLNSNLASTGGYGRALVNSINNRKKSYISTRMLLAEMTANYTLLKTPIAGKKHSYMYLIEQITLALEILGTVPSRLLVAIIWLSLILCVGNVFYILYVVFVYLFVSSVQPGWTTTSLFLSVFSTAFFFFTFVYSCIFLGRVNEKNSSHFFVFKERSNSDMFADITKINVTDDYRE